MNANHFIHLSGYAFGFPFFPPFGSVFPKIASVKEVIGHSFSVGCVGDLSSPQKARSSSSPAAHFFIKAKLPRHATLRPMG